MLFYIPIKVKETQNPLNTISTIRRLDPQINKINPFIFLDFRYSFIIKIAMIVMVIR